MKSSNLDWLMSEYLKDNILTNAKDVNPLLNNAKLKIQQKTTKPNF